jgi:hypothetical protein
MSHLPPKGEVAGLKNVWVAVDPKRPLKLDPVNGREVRESALWLKALVASGPTIADSVRHCRRLSVSPAGAPSLCPRRSLPTRPVQAWRK